MRNYLIILLVCSACTASIHGIPRPAQNDQLELALWNAIKDTNDPALFADYLQKYPAGTFALVARTRLKELGPAPTVTKPVDPKAGTMRTNPTDGLPYAWIPGGFFTIGCNPIVDLELLKAQGRAWLDKKKNQWLGACPDDAKWSTQVGKAYGFWMGQTEVTTEAYNRYQERRGQKPAGGKGLQYPVINIAEGDAENFCEASGGRLPSEAEWEYAARGPKNQALYGPIDDIAWHAANCNCDDKPNGGLKGWLGDWGKLNQQKGGVLGNPVGTKQPNGWGLYDMIGNVAEWTKDLYTKDYHTLWTERFLAIRRAPAVDDVIIDESFLTNRSQGLFTIKGSDARHKPTNVGTGGRGLAAFERAAQPFTGATNVGFRCMLKTLDAPSN